EWSESLQLATLWRFEQLRAYIIKNMDSMTRDPFTRIQIADAYGLTDWLHPAYAKLCARDASLTFEEGRRIGFERFAALVKIREDDLKNTIRGGSTGRLVYWKTAETKTNCTSECCRPRFRLNPREESFLEYIARAKALQAEAK
ncbi:hypothetical protein FRC01_000224, partial [Tulasnella sp. 417]